MIVDSEASGRFIDDELIPRLRDSMGKNNKLKEPKTVVTTANKKVFAAATGTIWGFYHPPN